VASVAIYEVMDTLEYEKTHIYAVIMLILSFVVLYAVYLFNQKETRKMSGVRV
jgi:molybdate transport system permease protein